MVISDMLSLISLAKGLADRTRNLNREYFQDFIEPAWESFSKIHRDYEASLAEYRTLLENTLDITELKNRVESDVLYSATLRIELSKIVKHNINPDDQKNGKVQTLVNDFAEALIEYFNSRRAFQIVWDIDVELFDGNEKTEDKGYRSAKHNLANPRTAIISWLEMMSVIPPENAVKAKAVILSSFQDMSRYLQMQYERVANAYYALRAELLKG